MTSKVGIYTPLGLDGYELCHPVGEGGYESVNVEVNGTSRLTNWEPIAVELIHENAGKKLVRSDSPWLGEHALIFRAHVVDELGAMLRNNGELLALACAEADLVIYNATRMVDALDEAASTIRRFSGGRIMWIQRPVFHAEAIAQLDVFKIPNLRVSPTFLSHRFVDRWKASGLKGLDFQQVWPRQAAFGAKPLVEH